MKSDIHIGIIGGGPAGYVAALHAAASGARVTLVEQTAMGGTCLHRGCIPTKRLVSASHLLDRMRDAGRFGIALEVSAKPDWSAMRKGISQLVNAIEKDLGGLLINRHITMIHNKAQPALGSSLQIRLNTEECIDVDRVLICTGSIPDQPPAFPFDGDSLCTSDELWHWDRLPSSLAIVGEGVVACEFAFIFRSLGIDVTMLGMMDAPLPHMDVSISSVLSREMRKKKIRFIGGRAVSSFERQSGHWQAYAGEELLIAADRVLVCTGRVPNLPSFEFIDVPPELTDRGAIRVDDYMRTTVPGVYAAGDVTGGCMLAHAASEQARIAVDHILGRHPAAYNPEHVPAAIFTSPEVAAVGMTEQQCREQELAIEIGQFELRALGKAHAMGEIAGSVKLIADADSRRLLGAHMIGANATEIIHQAVQLIAVAGSLDDILNTVHAHPTLSEAMHEAAQDVFGQALHKRLKTA